MITDIEVEGYRSLNPLKLAMRKGLNVLVGSNGSGKSNFISYLDFVSSLTTRNVHQAIDLAGGISRVFSRESLKSGSYSLKSKIAGSFSDEADHFYLGRRFQDSDELEQPERFEYAFEIIFNVKHAVLYFKSEVISLIDAAGKVLKITRRCNLTTDGISQKVKFSPKNHSYLKAAIKGNEKLGSYDEFIENILPEEDSIINRLDHIFPYLNAVSKELRKLALININPAKVRDTNSLSDYPFIEPDGSGTIATLFALEQSTSQQRVRLRYSPFSQEQGTALFANITSWSKEILQDLDRFNVELDPQNLRYKASMVLENEDGTETPFPFATLSDGTLKWISLVTMLFSNNWRTSIEEPENFLHPRMQRTLVLLLRSLIETGEISQLFITTHSETFLDACKVEEVFIVDFFSGRTHISHPRNSAEINKRLEVSQFGLGHYFKTGALYA